MWALSELATRSVGRVASARAGVRSAAEYESYGCVSKLESKVRSRSRKYNTGTADDRRARIARVQYSMRHACSTMILGHANVPKMCTTNSGSATQAAVPLSIRRWDRAACLRRKLSAKAGSSSTTRRRRRVDRITCDRGWTETGLAGRNPACLVVKTAERRRSRATQISIAICRIVWGVLPVPSFCAS